ncbi:MAG: YkvA family protein [Polyangiaceae bacterium]
MEKKAGDLSTSLRFFLNPKAGFFPKLFLLFAVLYVIMPLDLVPDVAVVIGWIDDLIALLAAGAGLIYALRRYQREQRAEGQLVPAVPRYVAPGVVETQGTEVR